MPHRRAVFRACRRGGKASDHPLKTAFLGYAMKALFIGKSRVNEVELLDHFLDEDFLRLMGEYKILESHIIYFSAGESKIKEILVKKDPSYSV